MQQRPNGPRVLVMGYRSGVARALTSFGVPYAVWNELPLERKPSGVPLHIAPFGRTAQSSRREAEALRALGPFTHVLGCTEASVVAASYARRVLGARLSTHTTAHRCHDKLEMKLALHRRGVPMTDFMNGNKIQSWEQIRARLGSPVVVKNRRSAGGVGLEIVGEDDDRVVEVRHRIVERFVDAPEASVESFIVGGKVVFENATEYYRKRFVNILPAPRGVDRPAGIRQINRRVIDMLRIEWGVTHMEAFLSPAGPLFGEIALRPPGGYIMELIGLAYGFDAWRAFVSVELGLPVAFPSEPTAVAAAVMLYPGEGRVTRIDGLDAIREHPSVHRVRLRAAVGESVGARSSISKIVGHVLLRAPDRATLLAAIDDVERTLRIEVDPAALRSTRRP